MNKVVLDDIIDVISGGTPKTSEPKYWENGDIGWLSVTDFNNDDRYVYTSEKKITQLGVDESNTKLLKRGDIIISARGTVGVLAQIGKPMCFNQSCFGIRGKKDIVDTDFLYYALKNYVEHIIKRSHGSVFNTINLASFELMELEIPKLISTQQKITKVLSDLDAKIELNNKINQELEAMAKTLYDYWFVQFDFPDKNGKPYKSSGGKMVYNEELKREIPEGWILKDLNDIESNIITGKTPSTKVKENFGGDIPFITINDIRQDTFIFKTERTLSELGAQTQKNKFIYENDICVSCIGTVGVIGFAGKSAHTNQQINTISKPKSYNRYYLYQYLNDYFEFNNAAKKGAVLSNMNKGEFESIPVLDAPIKLKEAYFKTIDSSFKKISNNIKQNHKLAELRDWLLPMLMNGQVTVGDVYNAKDEVLGMVAEGLCIKTIESLL